MPLNWASIPFGLSLSHSRPAPLAGTGLSFGSVSLPKQQRETREGQTRAQKRREVGAGDNAIAGVVDAGG